MIPSKDAQEILHHLYRSRYVDLLQLSATRQYNPNQTIYVWSLEYRRFTAQIVNNVGMALLNIRLRRGHETEVTGRTFMERAQQEDTDENTQESDKVNYTKFLVGLERLDVAALQLDDTLMVLRDF